MKVKYCLGCEVIIDSIVTVIHPITKEKTYKDSIIKSHPNHYDFCESCVERRINSNIKYICYVCNYPFKNSKTHYRLYGNSCKQCNIKVNKKYKNLTKFKKELEYNDEQNND